MNTIGTIIVDDEPLAREGIRMLLKQDKAFHVIAECANGREALNAIKKHRPDLIFLDVQMPELDGLGVVRGMPRDQNLLIVFVTAFDRFAIEAFDAHAIDYILKPVNAERFAQTLARIKQRYSEREATRISQELLGILQQFSAETRSSEVARYQTRFSVKTGDRIQLIEASDVDWIESEDYYIRLHVGKQSYLLRDSLSRLESELDPRIFIRIHRSTIVNKSRVKELKQHFKGEYFVILKDGSSLKLSRSYHAAVETLLSGR